MLLQELKEQAYQLSVSDRLALISAIIESLQEPPTSRPISQKERSQAINHLRGLLKTDQPAPTDAEVQTLLEERRAEKYLQ